MDSYPAEYLKHCLPLIACLGLQTAEAENESGISRPPAAKEARRPSKPNIDEAANLEALPRALAADLRAEILKAEGSDLPWVGSKRPSKVFRIMFIDKSFSLPSKKVASPPTSSDPLSPHEARSELHSPLSPLIPTSPAYPDIIMVPHWLRKHQSEIPPLAIAFFYFRTDPNISSVADQRLRDEILTLLSRLTNRISLRIVLIADKPLPLPTDYSGRISDLCRATGLSEKANLVLFPQPSIPAEISTVVENTLQAAQQVCFRHYESLEGRARMKRNRRFYLFSSKSHPGLSGADWQVRYDFKQAIFCEFRQNMREACKFYTSALATLLGSDGPFLDTPYASPRWNAARELTDTIGVRIIKSYLWDGFHTHAVQFWTLYRRNVASLLEHSTAEEKYTWETDWAYMMSELIVKVEVFNGRKSMSHLEYIPNSELQPPWGRIHRQEYWTMLSTQHAIMKQQAAESALPIRTTLETTNQEGQSIVPSKKTGSGKAFDYTFNISRRFLEGANEFEKRGKLRMSHFARVKAAKHYFLAQRYSDALEMVKPVWQKMLWREDGWYDLALDVIMLTYECARLCQDISVVVATQWELVNSIFPRQPELVYDLPGLLSQLSLSPVVGQPEKRVISISSKNTCSFLGISLAFDRPSTEVNQPIRGQISISSAAYAEVPAVEIETLMVECGGYVEEIRIAHKQQDHSDIQVVELQKSADNQSGPLRLSSTADLTISGGQTKVVEFSLTPRQSGFWQADAIVATVQLREATVSYTQELKPYPFWWSSFQGKARAMRSIRESVLSARIFPRSPRMDAVFVDAREQYYNNEPVAVVLSIKSGEKDRSRGTIQFQLSDVNGKPVSVTWEPEEDKTMRMPVLRRPFEIAGGSSQVEQSVFIAPTSPQKYRIDITITYVIDSDPEITITKQADWLLSLVPPLESQFRFTPAIHPDKWPQVDSDATTAESIQLVRLWQLQCMLAPHNNNDIELESTEVELLSEHSQLKCDISLNEDDRPPHTVAVASSFWCSFDIVITESASARKEPVQMDFSLRVTWRRAGSSAEKPLAVTMFSVPRFPVAPPELRVLARAGSFGSRADTVRNEYMIENPTPKQHSLSVTVLSNHTFRLSPGEQTTQIVQLPPFSRQPVVFALVPQVNQLILGGNGSRWIIVNVQVERRHEKMPPLYIWPTSGLQLNRNGGLLVRI